MAQFLNFGSYQRYKEDTKTFLEYLAKEAATSGFILAVKQTCPASGGISVSTSSSTSGPEPKSLAEKLLEKAAKKNSKRGEKRSQSATSNPKQGSATSLTSRIAETTTELLRQAKAIANNATIQVPSNVVRVVVRAIRARKRFAEWFSSNTIENGLSDSGHQYFIWVLEEALRILKPRMSSEKIGRKARTTRPITAPSHDVMSRFQRLLLEDDEHVKDTVDDENVEDIEDILDESSNPVSAFLIPFTNVNIVAYARF